MKTADQYFREMEKKRDCLVQKLGSENVPAKLENLVSVDSDCIWHAGLCEEDNPEERIYKNGCFLDSLRSRAFQCEGCKRISVLTGCVHQHDKVHVFKIHSGFREGMEFRISIADCAYVPKLQFNALNNEIFTPLPIHDALVHFVIQNILESQNIWGIERIYDTYICGNKIISIRENPQIQCLANYDTKSAQDKDQCENESPTWIRAESEYTTSGRDEYRDGCGESQNQCEGVECGGGVTLEPPAVKYNKSMSNCDKVAQNECKTTFFKVSKSLARSSVCMLLQILLILRPYHFVFGGVNKDSFIFNTVACKGQLGTIFYDSKYTIKIKDFSRSSIKTNTCKGANRLVPYNPILTALARHSEARVEIGHNHHNHKGNINGSGKSGHVSTVNKCKLYRLTYNLYGNALDIEQARHINFSPVINFSLNIYLALSSLMCIPPLHDKILEDPEARKIWFSIWPHGSNQALCVAKRLNHSNGSAREILEILSREDLYLEPILNS